MKTLLKNIAQNILNSPDKLCMERARLATEAYRLYENEPVPIKRAKSLDYILSNMTLNLKTNPVFAGNTSTAPHAWMLLPEFGFGAYGQVKFEHEGIEAVLDDIDEDIQEFWADKMVHMSGAIGHLAIDNDMLVNRGLDWAIAKIDSISDGDDVRQNYRRGMKIAAQAVIKWAKRYADAAEKLSENCEIPELRNYYARIAIACQHVPAKPARNIFEALQSMLLVHLALHIDGQGLSVSIASPDTVMQRFDEDAAAAPQRTAQLIAAFLLGISANSFQGRGSKTQAISIGGGFADGTDRSNAITKAFLDALELCPTVSDPPIFFRWHKNSNNKTFTRAAELISKGRSMPLLVNDEAVTAGYMDIGVETADAWDYCIIGCNELGIPGRCCASSFSNGMGFNELELLDEVIRGNPEKFLSIEDILHAYEDEVFDRTCKGYIQRGEIISKLAEVVPTMLSSACCPSCIESGDDVLRGMKYNNIPGLFLRGTTNAVNALAVVESLVFSGGEGKMSLPELIAAVDRRDGRTLALIENSPKWGRGDSDCDSLAVKLCEARSRALEAVTEKYELDGIPVCHVVRTLHHIDGWRIGNTLDGRAAGEPVADSIGPVLGDNTDGPTAALGSILKLNPPKHFAGIYNLNLTLTSSQATPEVVKSLTEGFFSAGGQELQINVLDVDKLRAAQKSPQQYRDIVVRVAGLNARFVELSSTEQDEIIQRAETAGSSTI